MSLTCRKQSAAAAVATPTPLDEGHFKRPETAAASSAERGIAVPLVKCWGYLLCTPYRAARERWYPVLCYLHLKRTLDHGAMRFWVRSAFPPDGDIVGSCQGTGAHPDGGGGLVTR